MLKICIHDQNDKSVGFDKVWSDEFTGKREDEYYATLLGLQNNPLMHGEMISLRFNDGEGGGCLASGVFLDAKFSSVNNGDKKVDVYFSLDKWRSW